ncbi:MAG: branched-chain amino acid ABC transporter permease [Treponema sp.]|nr:branched-chain amino acid ABC transporter permease [Treponema sp.]
MFIIGAAFAYLLLVLLKRLRILNSYHEQVIMLACVNIIMTSSLNLVNGFTGQFSIGHAGFMAIGAYVSATLTTLFFRTSSWPGFASIPFFLTTLVVGGLVAGFVGFLIGLPSLNIKGDYLAIVTLGAGEIIRSIFNLIQYVGGARGMIGIPRYSTVFIVFAITVIICLLIRNYVYSIHGRASIAIRENEVAASAMGINLTRYKTQAFVVAAFFAGIAGGLFAHITMFIQPEQFKYTKSIDYLVFMYAGGTGSISGSILGAGILTVLQEVLRFLDDWRMVIYALALIIIMLRRQNGIYGGKEFPILRMNNYLINGDPPLFHAKRPFKFLKIRKGES